MDSSGNLHRPELGGTAVGGGIKVLLNSVHSNLQRGPILSAAVGAITLKR